MQAWRRRVIGKPKELEQDLEASLGKDEWYPIQFGHCSWPAAVWIFFSIHRQGKSRNHHVYLMAVVQSVEVKRSVYLLLFQGKLRALAFVYKAGVAVEKQRFVTVRSLTGCKEMKVSLYTQQEGPMSHLQGSTYVLAAYIPEASLLGVPQAWLQS